MILSLVGMRGTGKTSVGKEIASQLEWPFCDADAAIERKVGSTISQIFESEGESGFRAYEEDVLGDILAGSVKLVLATGGGAILSGETRERLKNAGPVVWLTAPVEELAKRLSADAKTSDQRPSLTGKSVGEELDDVLKARRRHYESVATIVAPTSGMTPTEIAADICDRLSRELALNVSPTQSVNAHGDQQESQP